MVVSTSLQLPSMTEDPPSSWSCRWFLSTSISIKFIPPMHSWLPLHQSVCVLFHSAIYDIVVWESRLDMLYIIFYMGYLLKDGPFNMLKYCIIPFSFPQEVTSLSALVPCQASRSRESLGYPSVPVLSLVSARVASL